MSTAAAIAAVATVYSVDQQRKAQKAQRKSEKLQQRRADAQAARDRRSTIRQARVRRAQILNESAQTGAAGSSSESGAIGSLQGQLGSQLGASFQNQALSGQISRQNIKASRYGGNASMGMSVAGLATNFITPNFQTSAPKTTPKGSK